MLSVSLRTAHYFPLCHRHELRIRQKVHFAQCRRRAGLGGSRRIRRLPFRSCPGSFYRQAQIIEGGFQLNDFMKKNESFLHSVQHVLDQAMMLETQALDLYLRFADRSTDTLTKETFFAIADEEKAHLNSLGDLLEKKIQTI